MRVYQRARRARIKAEAAAAFPTGVVKPPPKDALREFARAQARAIANERASQVSASNPAQAPAPVPAPRLPPGPTSMLAIGGRPGCGLVPQGYGYPAPPDIAAVSRFTKWRENMETMVATLAARSDEQERRIKALEAAQADRRADAATVAQALAGLFQYGLRSR